MRVEVEPLVEERGGGHDKNVTGATQLHQPVTGLEQSGAVCRTDMVRPADDDRRAGAQPGRGRRIMADRADDRARIAHHRQQRLADVRTLQHLLQRRAIEIEKTTLDRPVALQMSIRPEPPREPFVGPGQGGSSLEYVGLIARKPQEGRSDRLLRERRPCGRQQVDVGESVGQLLQFGARARVVLKDRAPQRVTAGIEHEHRGHHPRAGDGVDRTGIAAVVSQQRRNRAAGRLPPLARVGLRPSRPGREQLDTDLRGRDHPQIRVHERGLDT